MDYIKKEYDKTRSIPAKWYLTSYKYKYDLRYFDPFLEKLKERKLIGIQCQGCNTVSFPPKLVCGKCLRKPEKWVQLRETGEVATYTMAYHKDEEGNTIAKPIVAVRVDGSDTLHIVELSPEIKFEDVYVGMPVKIHWADETTGGFEDIAYFDPIEDSTKDLPDRMD